MSSSLSKLPPITAKSSGLCPPVRRVKAEHLNSLIFVLVLSLTVFFFYKVYVFHSFILLLLFFFFYYTWELLAKGGRQSVSSIQLQRINSSCLDYCIVTAQQQLSWALRGKWWLLHCISVIKAAAFQHLYFTPKVVNEISHLKS